jgi:hypothetical protein
LSTTPPPPGATHWLTWFLLRSSMRLLTMALRRGGSRRTPCASSRDISWGAKSAVLVGYTLDTCVNKKAKALS